jgi:glutaredoxin-like protein
MPLLSDDESDRLRELLADELPADVRLIHFTRRGGEPAAARSAAAGEPSGDEGACTSCADTEELLAELAATNDHLALEIHDVAAEPALAEEFDIERVPATLISGPGAQGTLRLFGLPSGYEFATLLEDLIDVSAENDDLSAEAHEALEGLDSEVHLQVFVTPTCPHCPSAARTAHRLAMASPRVTADVIVANDFPDLAERYDVTAVPKVVIDDERGFVGALPEDEFVAAVFEATG